MLRVISAVLVLGVSLVLVADLSAGIRDRRRVAHQDGQPNFSRVDMMVRGLTLTDAQKAKVAELKSVYDPKFKENRAKIDGLFTDEQKKARKEAVEKAKADGKNRKEIWDAGEAAVKLTPEQKAKLDEMKKTGETMTKEVREKVKALLTPEQLEQWKKIREDMKKKLDEKKPEEKKPEEKK
jgi:Spy/CpxP family protein refolding chaperone